MALSYEETKAQYKALGQTYEEIAQKSAELVEFFRKGEFKNIIFIGCGSSYSLAKSYAVLAKTRLGANATALAGGDMLIYMDGYKKLLDKALIVSISRSGSTSEVVRAIKAAKAIAPATKTLSVVCKCGSPVCEISDMLIELPWAFDNSVCQTRTVSNLYFAGIQMMAVLSADDKTLADLRTVVEQGDAYLAKYEGAIKELAAADWDHAAVLADFEMEGAAEEASLTYKEICTLPSNYYHMLDTRHGPIVMFGKKTLVLIAVTDANFDLQLAMVKDVIKKGSYVVVYTDKEIAPIEGAALMVHSDMNVGYAAQGLPFLAISQLMSFFKSASIGVDPDAPTGLDAWIKL